MRVAVLGAGAIGGFLAAALAKAGTPIGVVARGAHAAAIKRDGIAIESDLGDFRIRVECSDDLRTFGPVDVALLTFKSHQWPGFIEQLRPLAHGGASIVTLQNGLPFWYVREPPLRSVDPEGAIAACFADDQVVGGVVHVSGTIVAPGRVRQSGGLRYVLGAPSGGSSERADRVAALLRDAGLQPEIDRDIRTTVWLKLVNNVGLNAVSVLRHMTIKEMLADAPARARARALMGEALRVGQAIGAVTDADLDARLDYAARLSDVKTSMLQDYERSRPLELDPILGAVAELAERNGIAVPQVRAAYAALRGLSRRESVS